MKKNRHYDLEVTNPTTETRETIRFDCDGSIYAEVTINGERYTFPKGQALSLAKWLLTVAPWPDEVIAVVANARESFTSKRYADSDDVWPLTERIYRAALAEGGEAVRDLASARQAVEDAEHAELCMEWFQERREVWESEMKEMENEDD